MLCLRGLKVKEENKQTVILAESVIFDGHIIRKIAFDLIHINQGWDTQRRDYAFSQRSSHSVDDIIKIFEHFKYVEVDWEYGKNKSNEFISGNLYLRYLYDSIIVDKNKLRICIDIAQPFNGEAIIVTIFKIKNQKRFL